VESVDDFVEIFNGKVSFTMYTQEFSNGIIIQMPHWIEEKHRGWSYRKNHIHSFVSQNLFRFRRETEPWFETIVNRINSTFSSSTNDKVRDLIFESRWGIEGREIVF
jgi:hypothetical protein